MIRMLIDTSSVSWTALLAGKDKENGREVEHNDRMVWVNSADYGYEHLVDWLTEVMDQFNIEPHQMIFVVEGRMSKSRRQAMYAGYKEGRDSRPKEAYDAFNTMIEDVTTAFRNVGATVATQDGVEGDDVLAYLSQHLDGHKLILSNDGDLTALMSDTVSIISQGELVTENPYGPFDTKYIRLYKALVGDGTEFKGASGFGPKAFLNLLTAYGYGILPALEQMVQDKELNDLESDVAEFPLFRKIIDSADHVYQSYACAGLYPEWCNTMRQPIQWKPGMIRDRDTVKDERLFKWAQQVRIVTAGNFDEALAWFKRKVEESPEFCLDLETSVCDEAEEWIRSRTEKGRGVDVISSRISGCGLTFGSNGQYGLYVSADHADTDNVTLSQLSELLQAIPQDKLTIAHNAAGFELPVLYQHFGKEWADNGWRGFFPNMVDSQLAATYENENRFSQGLKPLSSDILGYDQETYEEVTTIDGVQRRMNELSAQHVLSYGLDDCFTSQALFGYFRIIMEIEDSLDSFMKIEQKPMYMAALSYVRGTRFSKPRLAALRDADLADLPKLEAILNQYLINQGWDGTICPTYTELDAPTIKDVVERVTGTPIMSPTGKKSTVRTPDKLIALAADEDSNPDIAAHPDGPLLLGLLQAGNIDGVNELVARHHDGKPNFNSGSPQQMAKLLYEVMGLPIRMRNAPTANMREKGTREGSPQTDDDAINMAIKTGDATEEQAKVLSALLEMASIKTRTSLYWDAYPRLMHWDTGNLHPELRQCSTNTRRHSASMPNIQQMEGSSDGVRSVILPHHSQAVIVALDLAGQEVRLLADYTQDENLLSAFVGENTKDVHAFTAAMILDTDYDTFSELRASEDKAVAAKANEARDAGKATLFSSVYGSTALGIAKKQGIDESRAQFYLDSLDKAFPGVSKWKDQTEIFAQRNGWVPVLGGSRRHLREAILSDNKWDARKAMRQASNARIQMAGGNQIRLIIGKVWDSDLIDRFDVQFLWSIHDEVVFSIAAKDAPKAVPLIHKIMCFDFMESVPSESTVGIGLNFGQLVSVKGEVTPESVGEVVMNLFEVEINATETA